MNKFKVGNKVKIRKDSRYYGQSHEIGTIIKVDPDPNSDPNQDHIYNVRWNRNSHNSYTHSDLKLIKKHNKHQVFNI